MSPTGLLGLQAGLSGGIQAMRDRRNLEHVAEMTAQQFEQVPTPEALQLAQMVRANPQAAKQVADQFGGFDKLLTTLQARHHELAQSEAIQSSPDLVQQLTEQPQGQSGAFDDFLAAGVAAGLPPQVVLQLAQDLQKAGPEAQSTRPIAVGRDLVSPTGDLIFRGPQESDGFSLEFDAQGRPIIRQGSAVGLGSQDAKAAREQAGVRAEDAGSLSQLVDAINFLDSTPGQVAGGRGAAANVLSGVSGALFGSGAGDSVARWLTRDPNVTSADLETIQRSLSGIAIANREKILADRGRNLTESERKILEDAVGVASGGISLRNQDQVKASLRRLLGLSFTSDELARVARGEPARFDLATPEGIREAHSRLVSEIGVTSEDAWTLLEGLETALRRADALRALPVTDLQEIR